jgi:hypothetical protein
MGVETSLSFKGLITSPNHLGAASEGALVEADNVVIRFPDILEPRRGLETAPQAPAEVAVEQVAFFSGEVVTYASDGQFRIGTGDPLIGEFDPADPDYRMKTARGGQIFYAATDAGVIAIEETTTEIPRVSGIKAPVLPKATVVPDPASPSIPGFFENNKSVAYRVLYGFKDAHGQIHLGPASERVVVENTSGSRASVKIDVRMLTAPPLGATLVPNLFIRAYRSPISDVGTPPLDLMQLAAEIAVDSDATTLTDTISLTDIASPLFVQAQLYLYSNSEQGEQPNTPPPFATDLATWSQRLWFANTRLADSLTIQLLGVGGGGDPTLQATGLREGDTLTITSAAFLAPVVLTAGSVTDSATGTFKVISTGTPDENVTGTIKELAECINGILAVTSSVFDLVAYVLPGSFDVASQIAIVRNSVSTAASVGFSVAYAVPSLTCTVSAKVAGEQTIVTTAPHNLILGDVVRFSKIPIPPGGATYDAEVTTIVSGTQVKVTPIGADVPIAFNRVRRLYGETVWNPDLTTAQTSENSAEPARVYYSKSLEYEAVPLLHFIDVGVRGRAILRIVPQRDRLLVFKEEGTYAIFGDFPFAVQLVDDTVQILAPDSAAAVGSTVFALMDDGVMAITEGSIQNASEPIDYTLLPYLSSTYREQVSTAAFGVAFESQKLYALFMPQLQSDDYSTSDYGAKAYVYGLLGNAWTTWSYESLSETGLLCGRVDPVSDQAYYGTPAGPLVTFPSLVRERNTSTRFDYVDDYGEGAQVILCNVRWAASTMGSPFTTKQLREVHLHFRQAECTSVFFQVTTDVVSTLGTVPIPVNASADNLLIGGYTKPKQFRVLVPQEQQRGAYFMLRFVSEEEAAYWALNGYSLVFESTSERTGTVR